MQNNPVSQAQRSNSESETSVTPALQVPSGTVSRQPQLVVPNPSMEDTLRSGDEFGDAGCRERVLAGKYCHSSFQDEDKGNYIFQSFADIIRLYVCI